MRGILIFGLLSFTLNSFGSIPKEIPQIERILAQKSNQKFAEFRKLGPDTYVALRKIAFNDDTALGLRWQAFMAMVQLGEKESLPEIESALNSADWFLRDAALKVLPALDKSRAYSAGHDKL